MTHTICHLEDKVFPWWHVVFLFHGIEQTAFTAVIPPTLFLCESACFLQINYGSFHCPAGEMQLAGYGADSRPTFSIFVRTIFEVHIHSLGTMRNFFRVDRGEVTQIITPLLLFGLYGTYRQPLLDGEAHRVRLCIND